ncbi:hypothetical protein M885DRAFT_613825 [Pelagophyceae sp. CCMP2097]|nr:hypothetical protein M885DRAFT_613825 [Pelagophyceae sp. CCMP2097]
MAVPALWLWALSGGISALRIDRAPAPSARQRAQPRGAGKHRVRRDVQLNATPTEEDTFLFGAPPSYATAVTEILESSGAREAATSTEIRDVLARQVSEERAAPDPNDPEAVLAWLVDDAGFTGSEVAKLLLAWPRLLGAESAELRDSIDYLRETLQLKRCEIRKVARTDASLAPRSLSPPIYDTGVCPAVLATANGGPISRRPPSATSAMVDTVAFLSCVGVRPKHVREMVVRWPQLLSLEMAQLLAVTDFLIGVGCAVDRLGSLYRQAPWLLAASVGGTLRPAADFIMQECGLQPGGRMETIIRAYPQALLADPDQLAEPLALLRDAGVSEKPDVAKVVESFPLLLGLNANATMLPALDFLRGDLDIGDKDVKMILRAFPSLLGVDVEMMRSSVDFLREIGVNSVPRFVTRIPPVLAYDVESNLRPKMAFAVRHALSIFDIVRFPAFFSYPLETIIAPRAAYLAQYSRISLAVVGLATALTLSDDEFARRFAGQDGRDPAPQYAVFKKQFVALAAAKRRETEPSPRAPAPKRNAKAPPRRTTRRPDADEAPRTAAKAPRPPPLPRPAAGETPGARSADEAPPFPRLVQGGYYDNTV